MAVRSTARRNEETVGTLFKTKIRLNVGIIEGDPDENELPLALIEGDQASLEFLGNAILSHARHPRDCGIQMRRGGFWGKAFSSKSKMGLYLHRLPCWNELVGKKRPKAESADGKRRVRKKSVRR
jgi:hypothetical protein